jgi:hypothetical protein
MDNNYLNRNRQEYILNSNENNKPVDKEVYIQGNRQKVELDRTLEELSMRNDLIVSGHAISKKILANSASRRTTPSYIVDSEVYNDDNKDSKNKNPLSEINRGKEIIDKIKQDKEGM